MVISRNTWYFQAENSRFWGNNTASLWTARWQSNRTNPLPMQNYLYKSHSLYKAPTTCTNHIRSKSLRTAPVQTTYAQNGWESHLYKSHTLKIAENRTCTKHIRESLMYMYKLHNMLRIADRTCTMMYKYHTLRIKPHTLRIVENRTCIIHIRSESQRIASVQTTYAQNRTCTNPIHWESHWFTTEISKLKSRNQ